MILTTPLFNREQTTMQLWSCMPTSTPMKASPKPNHFRILRFRWIIVSSPGYAVTLRHSRHGHLLGRTKRMAMTTNGRKRRLGGSPEGRRILQMRNEAIWKGWSEGGKSFGPLALEFSLARSTIQKIIEQQRKGKVQ